MALTPDDLQRISALTLAHHDRQAQAYWEGTRGHDVSQNISALLEHIETPPPFDLLDFGCGPGRDLMTFKGIGHRPVGLEGWNGERYGAFHDWPTWLGHLNAAGFMELSHFYRPTGVPIDERP